MHAERWLIVALALGGCAVDLDDVTQPSAPKPAPLELESCKLFPQLDGLTGLARPVTLLDGRELTIAAHPDFEGETASGAFEGTARCGASAAPFATRPLIDASQYGADGTATPRGGFSTDAAYVFFSLDRGFDSQGTGIARYDADAAAFVAEASVADACTLCGVEEHAVRRTAGLIAEAGPTLFVSGLGLSELTQGTDSVIALSNIAMLTGSIGRPGAGMLPLRGQNNVQGAADMGAAPATTTGYQRVNDPGVRRHFESLWDAPLPETKGLTTREMTGGCCGLFRSFLLILLECRGRLAELARHRVARGHGFHQSRRVLGLRFGEFGRGNVQLRGESLVGFPVRRFGLRQ